MRAIFTIAAAAAAATAQANPQTCEKRYTPGQPYPWESTELMPGDQYAWVYLTIDKSGHAVKCGIGKTNIYSKDTRWYLCNSYQKNWYTTPTVKDGQPIETQVKHYLVITGSRHLKRDQEARKRWFDEHPAERRECYPEYGR